MVEQKNSFVPNYQLVFVEALKVSLLAAIYLRQGVKFLCTVR